MYLYWMPVRWWILVTSDHTDLERIEEAENIKVNWIREKLTKK
jgi:hypothetical protein